MQKVKIYPNLNQKEIARVQIRKFVNKGIQKKNKGDLYNLNEVFEELEQRYNDSKL